MSEKPASLPQEPPQAETGHAGDAKVGSDTSIAGVIDDYPVITLLRNATSYTRPDVNLYPGMSGEELRTAQSIVTLRRLTGDEDGLLGANAPLLESGYRIYKAITVHGIAELGDGGDRQGGKERMEQVLSVHDLAKSEAVRDAVERVYGLTDHDVALATLVRDNFAALVEQLTVGGQVDDRLTWLQNTFAEDAVLRAFFVRQRGIDSNFNVGRHLQGEADFRLFQQTVHDVNSVAMAEFVLDLLGGDGHKNPDGPVKFSDAPAAFNGIAAGLQKLVQRMEQRVDKQGLYTLWEELSYPKEDLSRLGLRRDSPEDKALTRVAFMGREHQKINVEEAHTNVAALRQVMAETNIDTSTRVVNLLQDTQGLDLGFAPHVMEAMRERVGSERGYRNLIGIIDQIAVTNAVTSKAQEELTINLDNKRDWSDLTATSSIRVVLEGPDTAGAYIARFVVTN